jgi:L-aspartate oxidase
VPIPKRLLSADISAILPVLPYDVVVVGAGVAGLAFTLRLAPNKRVALLTKGHLGESNTRYAQGGLSAAIGADDSPELHERDTLAAGAGLCDPEMVHRLVEGAPEAVEWLLSVGTNFDRDSSTGQLLLGREAAHSRRRVLHAGGDATGAEIERALVAAVRSRETADVFETAFALDLVIEDEKIIGLTADLGGEAGLVQFSAPTVVIAAGGAGQLWATTSNPSGATADGVAMAIRSGVAVADLEFVQFHPTVLAVPGAAPFLISEAVRGEGAFLRGADGERFMVDAHSLAELAPRDVVAREIQKQMTVDKSNHVSLDLRHLDGPAMESRFPTIARELAARGFNLSRDLIPIAPAAHYFMGGIVAKRRVLESMERIDSPAIHSLRGSFLASKPLTRSIAKRFFRNRHRVPRPTKPP